MKESEKMKRLVLALTSRQTPEDQQKALQSEIDKGYEVEAIIQTVARNPDRSIGSSTSVRVKHLVLKPRTKKRFFF